MNADPKTVHGGLTAAIADESFGGAVSLLTTLQMHAFMILWRIQMVSAHTIRQKVGTARLLLATRISQLQALDFLYTETKNVTASMKRHACITSNTTPPCPYSLRSSCNKILIESSLCRPICVIMDRWGVRMAATWAHSKT